MPQALERQQELFTAPEELALAGFLSGSSGLTLEAYKLDLRQFVAWCEVVRRSRK